MPLAGRRVMMGSFPPTKGGGQWVKKLLLPSSGEGDGAWGDLAPRMCPPGEQSLWPGEEGAGGCLSLGHGRKMRRGWFCPGGEVWGCLRLNSWGCPQLAPLASSPALPAPLWHLPQLALPPRLLRTCWVPVRAAPCSAPRCWVSGAGAPWGHPGHWWRGCVGEGCWVPPWGTRAVLHAGGAGGAHGTWVASCLSLVPPLQATERR